MLDRAARAAYRPMMHRVAARVADAGVTPGAITATGLLVGIAACAAVAAEQWTLALALWLGNRALDGLDGAVARVNGPSDLGGMLDFLADFVIYGGFIVAVVIADPATGLAASFLLATYLLNNVALLSFASLIERRGLGLGDERSLRLTTGLTEGTETVIAYSAICLWPSHSATIMWVFGGMVVFTVAQRIAQAARTLTDEPH